MARSSNEAPVRASCQREGIGCHSILLNQRSFQRGPELLPIFHEVHLLVHFCSELEFDDVLKLTQVRKGILTIAEGRSRYYAAHEEEMETFFVSGG